MSDTPRTISTLCDADNYTKYELVQTSRDLFTVADLEEMKGEGMTYQTRYKPHTGAENQAQVVKI